jgi:hypothetical protein
VRSSETDTISGAILNRFSQLLPDLGSTAGRFPLSALAAVALASYYLVWPDQLRLGVAARPDLPLCAIFLASLGVTLFAEARHAHSGLTLGAAVAVSAIVVTLCLAGPRIELNPILLLGGLQLLVGVAPFTRWRSDNATFWLFNHRLWVGWAMSLLAILVFGGGVSGIVASARYLFDITLPENTLERIWVLAGGLIGPFYWLSQVPRRFDEPTVEGPQTETVSQMTAAIAKFIVVPLLLIYAVILHAYAIKIGVEGTLPKGRLGWIVSGFGIASAAGALIVFPTRESGGRLVALFWRVWPWLLLVPLILLMLAIGQRIRQYGLTEQRYLVGLLGAWIAALIASQGLWRRDLRWIPGVICALLIAGSFGPWGNLGWPLRWQVGILKAKLVSTGLLDDGRLTSDPHAFANLTESDRALIGGVTYYLWSTDRLSALSPIFAGQSDDPFKALANYAPAGAITAANGSIRNQLRERINERLGLRATYTPPMNVAQYKQSPLVNFNVVGPWSIPSNGASRVVGQISLSTGQQSTEEAGIKAVFDGRAVTVTHADSNQIARFDIAGNIEVMDKLRLGGPQPLERNKPVPVARTDGDLPVELWLVGSTLRREDSGIMRVSLYLLVGRI